MGQQRAQTNNNITPTKTPVTSPNENNLHTIATRRPLALNGWSEGSKHNLEIPTDTEFSDLLRLTARKQRLLSKFSNCHTKWGNTSPITQQKKPLSKPLLQRSRTAGTRIRTEFHHLPRRPLANEKLPSNSDY
jgi:hypothetical protein